MIRTPLHARNRAANALEVQRVGRELFGRHGFHAVTVATVADRAGVSASTVYRYFGTKEALVLDGEPTEQLGAALQAASKLAPDTGPSDLFRRAGRTVLAETDTDELLARLRIVYADAELAAAFERRLLDRRPEVAGVFAAHRGAGRPGVRDDAAAGALLGVLAAVLRRWYTTDGRKSLLKMFDKGSSVCL